MEKKEVDIIEYLSEMQYYDATSALLNVNNKINKRQSRKWTYSLQKIAAILMIPLLLGSLSYIIYLKKHILPEKSAWLTVETLPGQKSVLELSDGTKVWLNSGTSISYPVMFGTKNRKVKLTGEAFFDVTKMEHRPFLVDIGDLNIKVLGTKFNVSNYPSDAVSNIYLKTGAIELFEDEEKPNHPILLMEPGEKVVFNKDENKISLQKEQTDICMAWIEGKLVFRNDQMSDVVLKLSRWFNVDIQIADPEISDYNYTATFQHESLVQILELLKISAPIDYKIHERVKEEDNLFSKNKVELYIR